MLAKQLCVLLVQMKDAAEVSSREEPQALAMAEDEH